MQRHKIKHPESVAIINARKGRYGHRLNGLICKFVTTKTESVPDVGSESSFSGILFTNHHFLEKEHSEEAKRACQ